MSYECHFMVLCCWFEFASTKQAKMCVGVGMDSAGAVYSDGTCRHM